VHHSANGAHFNLFSAALARLFATKTPWRCPGRRNDAPCHFWVLYPKKKGAEPRVRVLRVLEENTGTAGSGPSGPRGKHWNRGFGSFGSSRKTLEPRFGFGSDPNPFALLETFLDRVLAFDPTGEPCSLGRVATAKCSQIPYWSAPSPAILLTVSQPLSSGSAPQRARHCGLSKSVLLGAHWRSVCF
jgi:hypothetical protein